jgi:hypothetical protein
MSPLPQTPLRVVLIDFDWHDAETMLRLVARPEIEIRLVLGPANDSPAFRLAELGKLPRSTDLGDLTREMFDLALISDHSPRSAHVEAILTVLGTPSRSPERFLMEGEPPGVRERASRHLVARALALEGELSGEDPFAKLAPPPPQPPVAAEPKATPEPRVVPEPRSPGPARFEPPPRTPAIQAPPRVTASQVPPRTPVIQAPPRVFAASEVPPRVPASETPPRATVKEIAPPARPAPGRGPTSAQEERNDLAHLVHALATHTGARHAELRLGDSDALETVARFGDPDPLGEALAGMALQEGSEQVIRLLHGDGQSRCWGAWPIRTAKCRALVAASGMSADQQWEVWRDFAERLQERWDEPVPGPGPSRGQVRDSSPWQQTEQFRRSLEQALEENRRQGLRFGLHCYHFAVPGQALEELVELLPRHLRSEDLLCRPEPQTLLILTCGSPDTFFRLNQRILELWEGCWRMSTDDAPDPRVDTEFVELQTAEGALDFLAHAARWMGAAA